MSARSVPSQSGSSLPPPAHSASTAPTSALGLIDSHEHDETQTALPLLLECDAFSQSFLDANSALALHASNHSSSVPSTSSSSAPSLSTALSAPFSSPHCTFASTSFRHAHQLWRPCYTCNLVDSNGCCAVCAATCHAGHQLGEERLSSFFCDCGSRGAAFCLCLDDHSDQHSNHHTRPAHAAALHSSHRSTPGVGTLLSPDSTLDVSGGLFTGSPPVDLSQVCGLVLSTNQQLLHSEARPSLSSAVREAAAKLHAWDRYGRSRKSERKARPSSERLTEVVRRRGGSFALAAFAACLEEVKDEERIQPEEARQSQSPILSAIDRLLCTQSPYSLHLPSSQRAHFDRILRCYRSAALRRPLISSAEDSALRLWLTVGGVRERLDAALFLLQRHAAAPGPLSPSISSFISSFVREGHRRHRRLLRTSRSSHASEMSSRAVRLSIDLFCSSLALIPPAPSSNAASLASATASTHVSSTSVAQSSGVFPSLACSTDGDFMYSLSASHGLVKVGTGHRNTVIGQLIEQNPALALHAGGHLLCVRDGDEDVLLLRSPLLPAGQLLRVDCRSLYVTSTLTLPSQQASPPSSYAFELEHELVSSTPSASTTPHWQPLAPVLSTSTDFISLASDAYHTIQTCLASSSWRLGEPLPLSSTVNLVVLPSGIFLVIHADQQPPVQYRLRVRTEKRPLPLLPDQRLALQPSAPLVRFLSFVDDDQGVRLRVFQQADEGKERQECGWKVADEIAVDDYHHALPAPQPQLSIVAASSATASASSPSSTPSVSQPSAPRPCDGCGLVDWRFEEEFTCLDGCVGVSLCSWCQLHHRFNCPTHAIEHHMDHRLPLVVPTPANASTAGLLRSDVAGGVVYWDGCRVVLFPPRLPPSSLRHWRDFAVGDVVDVRDNFQKWSATPAGTQADLRSARAALPHRCLPHSPYLLI